MELMFWEDGSRKVIRRDLKDEKSQSDLGMGGHLKEEHSGRGTSMFNGSEADQAWHVRGSEGAGVAGAE